MPIDYDALKRLHEAATPGEWVGVPQGRGGDIIARPFETGNQMNPRGLRIVAQMMSRGSSIVEDEANASLLLSLRNAAPEILELIRDRERLEEVMANGWAVVREPFAPPGQWEVWDIRTDTVAVGDSPRAAIDAAIESTKK